MQGRESGAAAAAPDSAAYEQRRSRPAGVERLTRNAVAAPRKAVRDHRPGTIFDGVAYWATLIGVYLMVGGLMFYSGKEKLFDDNGHPPQSIVQQFHGTFVDTFPGTHAAWIILGVLEFGVFALLLLSLVRLEFLPHRDKWLLQVGLAVALLAFACLAFGQTVTKQYAGTASLYTYFGSTVVILILVSLMPPNRSDRWLGGDATRSS